MSGHHHEHEHHEEHHEHDHEHEHHGHEHHEHHHEHDHDHHHHGPLSISHHEGAVIGAVKGVIAGKTYEEAETLLAAQMREAGRRVTEAGGLIGHIKFILTENGRCGRISVTDEEENIKHFEGSGCRAEGVAIVFLAEDEKLEEILTETIGSILEEQS